MSTTASVKPKSAVAAAAAAASMVDWAEDEADEAADEAALERELAPPWRSAASGRARAFAALAAAAVLSPSQNENMSTMSSHYRVC